MQRDGLSVFINAVVIHDSLKSAIRVHCRCTCLLVILHAGDPACRSCLSGCLPISQSACLSACLPVCLSVCACDRRTDRRTDTHTRGQTRPTRRHAPARRAAVTACRHALPLARRRGGARAPPPTRCRRRSCTDPSQTPARAHTRVCAPGLIYARHDSTSTVAPPVRLSQTVCLSVYA